MLLFRPFSSSSTSLCTLATRPLFLLLLLAMFASSTLMAKPHFLLSCRVIGGICQGDGACLDEMSARFPDCYLEGHFDLLPPKSAEQQQQQMLAMGPMMAGPRMDKRAMKLMKVLMMKDRIPVGRR